MTGKEIDFFFIDRIRNGLFLYCQEKKSKTSKSTSIFATLVQWVRDTIGQPEGFIFVMTVLLTAITTNYVTATIMS